MEVFYVFEYDLALRDQPCFYGMVRMWVMHLWAWRRQDLGAFAELGILSEKANLWWRKIEYLAGLMLMWICLKM